MSELLAMQDVSKERLIQLLKAAYLPVETDKDGDIVIRDSGVNTFILIDSDKKLLNFISIWGFKPRSNETARLKFANKLNDDLILVRFCVTNTSSPKLYCDYQLSYQDGIAPHQIIQTYRTFQRVCAGAGRQDVDNLLDSD